MSTDQELDEQRRERAGYDAADAAYIDNWIAALPHPSDLSLREWPDPVLRQECFAVPNDPRAIAAIAPLVRQMIGIMRNGKIEGAGLAANQVGWPARVIVIDKSVSRHRGPVEIAPPPPFGDPSGPSLIFRDLVLINPVVDESDAFMDGKEGCLSFPGLFVEVRRRRRVSVTGLDLDGREIVVEAAGDQLARCLQHEVDHLDGKVFVERMEPRVRRKIQPALDRVEKAWRAPR